MNEIIYLSFICFYILIVNLIEFITAINPLWCPIYGISFFTVIMF